MRIFKTQPQIDFLSRQRWAFVGSLLLLAGGLAALLLRGGLNYGIDFSGGTIVQVQFAAEQNIGDIRKALGEDNAAFSLQSFGDAAENEFLITMAGTSTHAAQRVETLLRGVSTELSIRRVEQVGPKVGAELKLAAAQAILFSLVAILFYIWFRFQWRYGVAAIVALLHDVMIVLAAFAATQKEISLPVVAAILTVAGYSINDTIVIFDRIRENFRKRQKQSQDEIINESINQTMSRTLLTSGTTLFVLLAIFLFGGEIINDFAFALLIGMIVGTYSSVFIASPVFYVLLQRFPQKLG